MHNHGGKNNKSMMWIMIPCIILIAFVLFGGSNLVSSKYLWLIIVGVCVVPHIWMMFKGHGEHSDTNTEEKSDIALEKSNTAVEHKGDKHGGSCCH